MALFAEGQGGGGRGTYFPSPAPDESYSSMCILCSMNRTTAESTIVMARYK